VPKLLIDEGGQQSVFDLFENEVTIGRGASNGVQVADAHASKHHAAIRLIGGRLKLVDLESKNGTRVNGEFRNQRWLSHGDAISIGAATLTFDASDAAPAAKGRPAPKAAAAVAASVAVPAPAPRAAPARAPAPHAPRPIGARAGSRGGGRRGRDEEGGDEEERPTRGGRGSNSTAVAVGVGAGLVVLVLLLILILKNIGGLGANAAALVEAKELHKHGKTAEALRYLETHADPSDEDGYRSVKIDMDMYRKILAQASVTANSDEANKVYKQLVRDKIEMHKNGKTTEMMASELRAFAEKYMGTPAVHELLNSNLGRDDYAPKFREMMGETKAWAEMDAIASAFEKNDRGGLGARILEFQKTYQGTMKVLELERSPIEPYPDLRKLAGLR
jgi:hypothetical protein